MVRARKKQRQEPKPLPPNTKGQRMKGRNVGKLMKMLDVPMEVFLEIASYLQPVDILQLVRASRDLRCTLLSRSSRHVWVAAFQNVDPPLPDCPDGLSEPEYAYLVFERFCQVCGAGRATNVDYAIRVRLCKDCWNENMERGHQLAKKMDLKKDKAALRVIYDLVPRATCEWFKSDEPLLEDVQQISRDLFYGPQFIDVVEQYLDLRDDGDERALRKFIKQSIDNTLYELNFHREVIEWTRDVRADKKAAGEDAVEDRKYAIEKRLLELGWKRDDWPYHSTKQFYTLIYQPRPLTERIWNTIRPKLVALLEQERSDRAAKNFEYMWFSRRNQLLQHYREFLKKTRGPQQQHILPGLGDALELPCMHALLTSKEPKEDITVGEFAAIEPTIMVEAEGYRDEVYSNLVRAWQEHLKEVAEREEASPHPASQKKRKGKKKAEPIGVPEPSVDSDPDAQLELLNEPTTVFKCKGLGRWGWQSDCDTTMSYIGIMEHWRTIHHNKPCSDGARADSSDSYRKSLPQLLDVMGLDEKTTHAELHKLITSGRPICSCGKDLSRTYKGKVPTAAILAALRSHIRRGDEYGWGMDEIGKVHDRITFEPLDEGGPASSL